MSPDARRSSGRSSSAAPRNGSARVYAARMRRYVLALILASSAAALSIVPRSTIVLRAAGTLDIYFIDVEGGQSTLIVTPAGESLLVDTGYAGDRDADRIAAAAKAAAVQRIDYLLIT